MKISSINNAMYSNNANFKGVWGKTSVNTDMDPVINIPTNTTTYYYYPFKNESDNDVQEIAKNNKSANIFSVNGKPRYVIQDCKICARLPITEDEYSWYSSLSEDSVSDIPQESEGLKLVKVIHKMLNNKFSDEPSVQKQSAQNQVITKMLLDKRI